MNTEGLEQFSARITLLTDQMETFAKRHKATLPPDQAALVETLSLIETIRINRLPQDEICARLRGTALKTQHFSPVLTAHLELIADEYNMKGPIQ